MSTEEIRTMYRQSDNFRVCNLCPIQCTYNLTRSIRVNIKRDYKGKLRNRKNILMSTEEIRTMYRQSDNFRVCNLCTIRCTYNLTLSIQVNIKRDYKGKLRNRNTYGFCCTVGDYHVSTFKKL